MKVKSNNCSIPGHNMNNNKYHLDLYGNYDNHWKYFQDGIKTFVLESVVTKCFNSGKLLLKQEYGNNWSVPIKLCDKKNKKWIDNINYNNKI